MEIKTQLRSSEELLQDPYYLNVERRLTRISCLLAAGILVWAIAMGYWLFAGSFLAGATLSYWNFIWMKQGIDRLVAGFQPHFTAPVRSGRVVILKYLLRYALIGGTLYAIFRFRFLDFSGAVLGLLLFVLAVIWECIYQVVKTLIEDRQRGRT